MSEMPQRVADAIARHLEEACASVNYNGKTIVIDGGFNTYELARAAIEAMREPTPDMLAAAKPEPVHLYPDRDESYRTSMRAAVTADQLAARQQWRDMIDAALEREK
jgi:hypothetical protein